MNLELKSANRQILSGVNVPNLKSFNRFARIETKAVPFIPSGDNTLTFEVQNYSGDLMIDHLGKLPFVKSGHNQ